jgi:dynein heavy chain
LNIQLKEALQTIYNSILSQYLGNGFQPALAKYSMNIVNVSLTLHQKITSSFLPTAIKFHYIFNLRDLSNIFQVYKIKLIKNLKLIFLLNLGYFIC